MLKTVSLEVSLKPFKSKNEADIQATCEKIYTQWFPLFKDAENVSIMFWTSDGSELLDYTGNLNSTFDWARYIGVANPEVYGPVPDLPQEEISIHRSPRLYCENPPEYTYSDLKRILDILRATFKNHGKNVRIGTTFDPGPEFAVSDFKYKRHTESCMADTLGADGCELKSFVCCYAELNADNYPYAGFPNGIEQGTTFGKFLGRQTKHFCTDIGFDFIWLSNGFGFGLETWGVCGAVFNGLEFDNSSCEEVKDKIFQFWNDFRAELPELPVETRGTNLSTGMDLSSDVVPLREIYKNVPGIDPPVNSPWAALNGDFGLELAGWMSHIAEIPDGVGYPYRFYIHDPWFINSPWLDRYGRNPHDIYMPMAITRINKNGDIMNPDKINFLTIDDSYGDMPDAVPDEVIPHIKCGLKDASDMAGPVTWLYPFDEYHDMTFAGDGIEEVFFGDWFMRTAINTGFMVNTVVSTNNFTTALKKGTLSNNVVVTPTATCRNKDAFASLRKFSKDGGKIIFYGPVNDPELADFIGVKISNPIEGELTIDVEGNEKLIKHTPVYSAGSINTIKGNELLDVIASHGDYVLASLSGNIGWVRGTNSFYIKPNGRAPEMFDRNEYFYPELLMRTVLGKFGYVCEFDKYSEDQPEPVIVSNYCRNALYISSYVPNLSTTERFKFPEGAPVFVETETVIKDGMSVYHFPKAEHLECRVFLEMAEGVVKCKEACLATPEVNRRLEVKGLKNATLRFRPETGFENNTKVLVGPTAAPHLEGTFLEPEIETGFAGTVLTYKNVNGDVLISW